MARTDGHLSHPYVERASRPGRQGQLGPVRVTSNQHGVTLAFDRYEELPVVKNEKTGALGRRAIVLTDVCFDPSDNDWLVVTNK